MSTDLPVCVPRPDRITGVSVPRWTCVFCGTAVSADDSSASSFLFLARVQDDFRVVEHWADDGEGLQGHQFFCHAACFSERMDPVVRQAVFDPDF